jgi:mRNA-degrading endonuclease RelE of RelBE toxin-antitoxin system
MRTIRILPSFERSLKKISPGDKNSLKKSLEQLNSFLLTGSLPKGLGLKKLEIGIYEIRVNIRMRIIMKVEDDVFYLVLAGSHSDVKRYLRSYR